MLNTIWLVCWERTCERFFKICRYFWIYFELTVLWIPDLIYLFYFYYFLKVGGRLSVVWPPDVTDHEKKKKLFYSVAWWLYVIFEILTWLPIVLGVYHFRSDLNLMLKSLSELTAFTEVCTNTVLCKVYKSKLKATMSDIDNFLHNANAKEMTVVKKYVDKHKYLFSGIVVSFIGADVVFCAAPMVVPGQQLPVDAWYPFSTEPPIVKFSIYLLHIIACTQTTLGIFTDMMIAYMIWMGTTRFELLECQFLEASNRSDVRVCIKKHQRLILFVGEIQVAVKYILLKSYGIMAVTMIAGGYQLINHQPLSVAARFILIVIVSCVRLYVTAKPADDLKISSIHITSSIFDSNWPDLPFDAKMSLLTCMQRAQKPLVISVSGLITELSLEHYVFFLSTTLKYFMNLRVVFDK